MEDIVDMMENIETDRFEAENELIHAININDLERMHDILSTEFKHINKHKIFETILDNGCSIIMLEILYYHSKNKFKLTMLLRLIKTRRHRDICAYLYKSYLHAPDLMYLTLLYDMAVNFYGTQAEISEMFYTDVCRLRNRNNNPNPTFHTLDSLKRVGLDFVTFD